MTIDFHNTPTMIVNFDSVTPVFVSIPCMGIGNVLVNYNSHFC